MTSATGQLTVQLLEWIESRPRTYDDVIDAWRTSCPRLSVWEDALIDGLVECRPGRPQAVLVTSRGRALLGHDAQPLRLPR